MKNISQYRRQWLKQAQGLGLIALGLLANPLTAFAKKQEADEAIKKIVGGATIQEGKVTLTIPPLVENGNLVVLKVSVDSSMTANDYVKTIHVIAEGNPLPNIFTVYLTPRSGTANITTRVRLADSQKVWAIAQMSNGSFWQGSAETLVTLSACTEVV
ncbi:MULTISPECIES: SoxY-related AACIE arm protein [unclassified Polynucleobacter]|jgi:sulfur-oxidizing protein SoxY|uniref:SoxY-related AACIE arm protein n=1 Tax=unclassified Polynucleobacter TaxID=2640945 RepID=UPI00092950D2|nr:MULTISPECIES: SoxY-related AACIE arm protein [unclassified Polynucleobacter]MBU3564224.1 SoxY-related AACIE arm protein [Polynucleobacter sp. Tro8-14-1]OJI04555.1 sulfur oxidation protein SoxY [Polynucleobacter sp. MWH-Adler-W8]